MKITAVIGSPSVDGNTAVLARAALNAAADEGAEVREIFLAGHNIEFCRGCMTCMRTGVCIVDDDARELRKILYDSDGIILASPSYGIGPTARMKNFLTDRIGMYTVYTSSLGGKYFAGISTAGGIGARKVARTLGGSFVAGFFRRGYFSGSLGVHRGHERIESIPGALEKARRLGKKMAGDILRRRRYPLQRLGGRILNRLVVRRKILSNILNNRDGALRAVYLNLVERKLIRAEVE